MALTFRAFFQGLSQAAPGLVNTLYQYRQDEIKNMYQERQMRLEENKAGVYAEYMGAATERENMTTQEIRELLPAKKAAAESTEKTATLLAKKQQQIDDAVTQKYGENGWGEREEKEWELGRQETQAKIDQAKAAIAASNMQVKSFAFQIEVMKERAEVERAEVSLNLVNTYRVLAKATPEAQEFMDKAIQDNSSEDRKKFDTVGFMNTLRQNGGQYFAPEQMKTMLSSGEFLQQVELKTNMERMEFIRTVTNAAFSEDSKVRDSAFAAAGISDKSDVKPNMAFMKDPTDLQGRTYFDVGVERAAYAKLPRGAISISTMWDEVNTRGYRGIPASPPDYTGTILDPNSPYFVGAVRPSSPVGKKKTSVFAPNRPASMYTAEDLKKDAGGIVTYMGPGSGGGESFKTRLYGK